MGITTMAMSAYYTMLHDGHLRCYLTPKRICPKHSVSNSIQWAPIIVPLEIVINSQIISSKSFIFFEVYHIVSYSKPINVPLEFLAIPESEDIPMKYPPHEQSLSFNFTGWFIGIHLSDFYTPTYYPIY